MTVRSGIDIHKNLVSGCQNRPKQIMVRHFFCRNGYDYDKRIAMEWSLALTSCLAQLVLDLEFVS